MYHVDSEVTLCSEEAVFTEPVSGLLAACTAYRDALVKVIGVPERYSKNYTIDARRCYSRVHSSRPPQDSFEHDPWVAANALLELLPPALRNARPEVVDAQCAGPHQDWESRFLNLVLGTTKAGPPDAGYLMGIYEVEPGQDLNQRQARALLEDSGHRSIVLTPGTFFSFNPQRNVHWSYPVAPTDNSHLILLQWEFGEGDDLDARWAIEEAFSVAFTKA